MTDFTRTLVLSLAAFLPGAFAPLSAGAACGEAATPIHTVQGSGPQSPRAGDTLAVEGILTRDARYPGGFDGFYLQQADAETDNDPATSEALFVYTRKTTGKPGQRLRVTGTIKEYHDLTEMASVDNIQVCGKGRMPEPIELTLPWPQNPESLENMRVRFLEPLTVVEHYNLAVYGEVTLAASDQITATEYLAPGPDAFAQGKRNRQQRVTLDDGSGARNPEPVPWPPGGLSRSNSVRAGDTVSELAGILDYRFGQWRLQPIGSPQFNTANPRPSAPVPPADNSVRVMALNLQNFFNGNGRGGGFPTDRGAQSKKQFRIQSQRLATTIKQAAPDILAVSELENDGYDEHSAIADLTRTLGQHWRFVATPGDDGSDAIRSALLYRSDRVIPIGKAHRLQSGTFARQSRPPVTQLFRMAQDEDSQALRVVAPHLKSKSCRNASGANADQNDGQGCFNQRRTREAGAILDWIATLPTDGNLAGTLIAGDLNSYAREEPLHRFEAGGYRSLVHHFHPCTSEACQQHSYRFKGQKGSLDYLLASEALLSQVAKARAWNINADEPRALSYRQTTSGDGPWRASDHNPVISDIRLIE